MKAFLSFLLVAVACAAPAQTTTTLYKSVGPDGRTVYSDQPPSQARDTKTLTFSSTPASPLSPETLAYVEQLRKAADARVAAPAFGEPVLFTAVWCGYCRQAKAYLARKQIAYRNIDIGTKDGLSAFVSAGGRRGVPLLVANGKSVFGFSAAEYDALLTAPRP